MVRLLLSDDGQSLDVVESNLDHSNHVISKEVYLHLPMQRRLDKAHKMQAETLLSVCGNAKLVQQHMQNVSGKVVLLKDIANISHRMKKQAMPNNLKSVLQQLEETGDSVVDVLVSEDNSFKGIFYQDVHMQNVFEAYPEMLLVGETFKLIGLQVTAYLMVVIDGNGQSEVASLLLLADQSRSTVSAAVEAFQHHNPAWLKTQTIMTDKDFPEREVFTSLFPGTLKPSLFDLTHFLSARLTFAVNQTSGGATIGPRSILPPFRCMRAGYKKIGKVILRNILIGSFV